MNTRQKNIAKASWELVVALFVFFGTFFMAFMALLFNSLSEEKEDDMTFYGEDGDGNVVAFSDDESKVIGSSK